MKIIYLSLAALALPLIFFTLYLHTIKGTKIKLGSFYLIKNFSVKMFKVRSLKDIISLILRLTFGLIIFLIIFNYQEIKKPERKVYIHSPQEKKISKIKKEKLLNLNVPHQGLDAFDEDIFFLESFVKNYPSIKKETTVIYAPSEKRLEQTKNDLIIFPGLNQERYIFGQWADIFSFSSLQTTKIKIKDSPLGVNQYYRLIIEDPQKIKTHLFLEDGTVLALSFEYQGKNILIFGVGLASFWGEVGLSGLFLEVVDTFLEGSSLAMDKDFKPWRENFSSSKQSLEEVKSKWPLDLLLKIAILIFLLEYLFFGAKKFFNRQILIFFLFFTLAGKLSAEDFKFVELGWNKKNNQPIFSIIKDELKKRTSIQIDNSYHEIFSLKNLKTGELPNFPFLWVMGIDQNFSLSSKEILTLKNFIKKGGIVFFDSKGINLNSFFSDFFKSKDFVLNKDPLSLPFLARDHAIYRSFYLVTTENFQGLNVSKSTQRTALIFSNQNLGERLKQREEMAIRTAVNIVLYMLSGNYKSDQIHTRQILKKLKQRELYK